jgi:hypothetical protein
MSIAFTRLGHCWDRYYWGKKGLEALLRLIHYLHIHDFHTTQLHKTGLITAAHYHPPVIKACHCHGLVDSFAATALSLALLRCSCGHWQDWQKLLIYTYLSEPDSDSDLDSCHLQPTTVIISSSSSFYYNSNTLLLFFPHPSSTHAITPPPLFSAFLLRNKLFHRAKKSRTSTYGPLALSALSLPEVP